MSRIKPGDLCLIVAEAPECACNIGATLVVVQLDPYEELNPPNLPEE